MAIDPNNPLLNGPRRVDARPVVRLTQLAVVEASDPGLAPISEDEIMAARSPKGSWTRATLAGWGVAWPPKAGWKDRLLKGKPQEPIRERFAKTGRIAAPQMNFEPAVSGEQIPRPGEPGFDSTKHGLLSPPRVTYRKLY